MEKLKKEIQKSFCMAIALLTAFALWTAALLLIDVRAIGPDGSSVGFASLNRYVHELSGVHMRLYVITDCLSLLPLAFMLGFALLGLTQWIRRKQLGRVDLSILILGGFYFAVMAAYLFFEAFAVNYRPILINGCLEASYPSSTTMLVICVMATAVMQLNERIGNERLRRCLSLAITVFSLFMVMARLVSGVHWFTDIVGAALLSAGLVTLYRALCLLSNEKAPPRF